MPRKTKRFVWRSVREGCAKGSYRVKKTPAGAGLVRFCCPKGKWKSGYCHGGMKLQAVARRRKGS